MGKSTTKAQNKYISKKYDRINLTVLKGEKESIKAYAELHGESVNGFINRAIAETMEREYSHIINGLERRINGDDRQTNNCYLLHA